MADISGQKQKDFYKTLDALGFIEEVIEEEDDTPEYKYKFLELFPNNENCDLTLIAEHDKDYVSLFPYDETVRFYTIQQILDFHKSITGGHIKFDLFALLQ